MFVNMNAYMFYVCSTYNIRANHSFVQILHVFISDVNECMNTSVCEKGSCHNTIGSYICLCEAGYRGTNCDLGRCLFSKS